MAKQKCYVVWAGRKPGIYTSWADCQAQISGYTDAKYKSFESRGAAEQAYKEGWKAHWGKGSSSSASGKSSSGTRYKSKIQPPMEQEIDYNSISVDVGTRGNPGPVEYKGVDTKTGAILFSYGPVAKGTNNLGEFLAIVHGLAYLKQQGSNKTIYSDSVNALKWLREKKVSSTLVRDESTREIWTLVDRAEQWLRNNTYSNKVLKWDTKSWGEIKADYGRK